MVSIGRLIYHFGFVAPMVLTCLSVREVRGLLS